MITKSTLLKFYKRKDIREVMIEHSQDKEIAVRFEDYFGKRPDTLVYPNDVLELALQGSTSFHASEERWSNPLALSGELSKKDLDELRIGWDLVLDIDCKFIEYSKICADLIVKFFQFNDVKDISCKFSGNKGFHIGVPFEAFPQKIGEIDTAKLFPDAAKKIALYVKDHIEEELGKRILALEGGFAKIKDKVELEEAEITRYVTNKMGDTIPMLNVEKFLEIDTVLISSRHLYRMPYSLHEKSGLVSLPIDPNKVIEFEKPMAKPDVILTPMFTFLDRNVSGESAARLLKQALDYSAKVDQIKRKEEEKRYQEVKIENPIQELFFPPCMKRALEGMEDGKKRSVFFLMNFLGKIGWSKPEVEVFLKKWNMEKNREKLREVFIKGQMASFKPGEKLPPNCDNAAYYQDLGVCLPDPLCKRIKNPVNYTLIRWKSHLRDLEENKRKEKKEEVKKEDKKEVNEDDKSNNI